MNKTILPLLLTSILALPPRAAALADPAPDFGTWIARQAASSPDAEFGEPSRLPSDFSAFLAKEGLAVQESRVRPAAGGEALSNQRIRVLYVLFKTPLPAPSSSTAPGASGSALKASPSLKALESASAAKDAAPVDASGEKLPKSLLEAHFVGVEVGKGPHPDSDPFWSQGSTKTNDIGFSSLVRVDGLGAKLYYKPTPSWPGFTFSVLPYMDIVGGANLGQARDGIYQAFFQQPETPQGGVDLNASVAVGDHFIFLGEYDTKQSLFANQVLSSHQQGSAGVSILPLGKNNGKDWNFSFLFEPNYQRQKTDSPQGSTDDQGAGFTAGTSLRYALDKLPIKWLRPGSAGNGWVWPDNARTSVQIAESAIAPVSLEWATQASIYITKYVMLTPGVRATWRPNGAAAQPGANNVGVAPLLGLDIKNPNP